MRLDSSKVRCEGKRKTKTNKCNLLRYIIEKKIGEKGSKTKINKSTFGPCEEKKKIEEKNLQILQKKKYVNRNARSKGKLLFLKQQKEPNMKSDDFVSVRLKSVQFIYRRTRTKKNAL